MSLEPVKNPIPFSRPLVARNQSKYLDEVVIDGQPWGGGSFFKRFATAAGDSLKETNVLPTQSCSAALELAMMCVRLRAGDEVIMPSYNFVSAANAVVQRGAKPVFCEISNASLNADPSDVERLITPKTKAVVVVHYGGQPVDMDAFLALKEKFGFVLIEDAAQAIGSSLRGKPLGTWGDFGAISFHGTKNLSSGEGGLFVCNLDRNVFEEAQVIHEKGTDRSSFLRGEVDKYTWQAVGSSFMPSEFTSALMLAQLEELELVDSLRRLYWDDMFAQVEELQDIGLQILPNSTQGGNSHMFAVVVPKNINREELIRRLRLEGIGASSHYEPLHSSPYSRRMGFFSRDLKRTSDLSSRLVRLPIWSTSGLNTERIGTTFKTIYQSLCS